MSELDDWWKEQAARKPKTYQVWTCPGRKIGRLMLATDDADEAASFARALRKSEKKGVLVLDATRNFVLAPLRISATGGERGKWRVVVEPKAWTETKEIAAALAFAAKSTEPVPVAALGVSRRRLRRIAAMVEVGRVEWRKRWVSIERVELVIEGVGRKAVVRRAS